MLSDDPSVQNKRKVMESRIFGDSANEQPSLPQRQPQNRSFYKQSPLPPLPTENQNTRYAENIAPIPDAGLVQQPRKQMQQSPFPETQYKFVKPQGSRFVANATVQRPQTPTFDGIVTETSVPPLTPFPDFTFEAPQIQTSFEFHVRPLTTQSNRGVKKLNISSNDEMRKMREEIQADSAQFSSRIRGFEKSGQPSLNL